MPSDEGRLTSSCFSFIDNYLTYNGCVASHQYDTNFWGNTWRIFLNRPDITHGHTNTRDYGELWKQTREGIKLLDQNGLTVDEYIY